MKKLLPYILILIVLVGILSPMNQVKAQVVGSCTYPYGSGTITGNLTDAQCTALNGKWSAPPPGTTLVANQPLTSAGTVNEPSGLPGLIRCSPVPGLFDVTKCVTALSYYLLYMPTAAILWFGGQLFNGAVAFSLNGKILDSDMVSLGWGICRDVANLFFIFILLYIAIATILQLSSYGMKSLLAKLVIIALLVNFSLVITKVIIDASNILALEFYNKMTVQGGGVTQAIFGTDARDISSVFMAGFNPEQIISQKSFQDWSDKTPGSSLVMLVTFLIASTMNLVATFILMAGGLLFIIRIAILWLLMILAPLAFLFMVLPKTQQYASQWWNKLFNQAFFAPAFLFLFYLVAMMINKGFLKSVFKSTGQNVVGLSGIEAFFASIVIILLNFTVLAVLMITCLAVAKQMGAYGAGMAQSLGKGAAKWGRGYAGRTAGRMARRATAPVAEAFATGEGKGGVTRVAAALGRGIRKVPLVGGVATRAGAEAGVASRARLTELQKGYEKYTNKELKNMTSNLTPFNRTAVIQELSKRGDLREEGGLTRDHIENSRKVIERYGGDVRDIDRLRPDVSPNVNRAVASQRSEDVMKLDVNLHTNATVMNAMVDNYKAGHIQELVKRGDQLFSEFMTRLKALDVTGANSAATIAAALTARGNTGTATWLQTTAAQGLLGLNP